MAGILNYLRNVNNTLYLTLIGGGVFGNKIEWIINAIYRSLNFYKYIGLDVVIVSHGRTNEYIQELIKKVSNGRIPVFPVIRMSSRPVSSSNQIVKHLRLRLAARGYYIS